MSFALVALDIGGVLAHIDKDPLMALLEYSSWRKHLFFKDFFLLQRGLISADEFLAYKSRQLALSLSDLTHAFSSMLRKSAHADCLPYVKAPYVFVSTINEMHYRYFIRALKPSSYALKNSVLSCRLGFVKPHPRLFSHMIGKVGIDPQHIIFIDDKPDNINVAQDFGLHAFLCPTLNNLPSLLQDHKLLR